MATDREVNDVQNMVKELANNQGRIVNKLDQFTTIINHTYDEIQANRDHTNQITRNVNAVSRYIKQELQTLQGTVNRLRMRLDIELVINQIEKISYGYVQAHEAWLLRKDSLEAGRLTETILPPPVLKSILSSTGSRDAKLVTPLQWYYKHMAIIPIWTSGNLLY